MSKLYILIFLIFLTPFLSASKNDSTKSVIAFKLDDSIILDGVLNESVYLNPAVTSFTQKDPDEGKPASEKTEVWVSYDESNIYFSGRMFDTNADSIDVSLLRRDYVIESDWFWVYLDPYNDDRTGFFFAVNPAGSKVDGVLFNDSWDDNSWDGIWESKTTVDENGWYVEIKIPFTQLRFKEADEMIWGINFNRDIKRRHEMSFYVLIPKKESGFVSKFADLKGLDGIKPKQRLEILPYVVQKAQYLVHDPNDPYYKSNQYSTSIGADLKFSIGSNLNVDATINPDFGQVEVDPAIVNLSAFETFYEEKRPFFIEGSNIFAFGFGGANNNWGFNFGVPELFYSRRIGRAPQGRIKNADFVDYPLETRILGAAKLSGKIDESWTIGALTSFTERTNAEARFGAIDSLKEVEPFTHYGVFRTQKEFNSGKQSVGFILTTVNRAFKDSNLDKILSDQAYTYGIDGWTFLDEEETYVVTGSIIGSYTSGTKEYLTKLQSQPYRYLQRPDKTNSPIDSNLTSIAGYFSRVMINKQKGNFYLNAALGLISPGFEYNDLGSQWMADRINGHIVTGYRWFEPDGVMRRKNIYIAYNRTSDFEDNVSRSGFYATANTEFINYWGMNINASYNFKSVSTNLTRGGPKTNMPANFSFNIMGYTDSREKIIFNPYVGYWRNTIGSNEYDAGIDIEWKPSAQISFSVGPEYFGNITKYQWVGGFKDTYAINTYNTRYVFAEIDYRTISANIRLNWIFTPTLSLQLYLQPLISVGDYDNYKELTNTPELDYRMLGTQGSEITYDEATNSYNVDPDASGPAPSYSFDNPDFNFKSLRGNLVLRWEVLPGSVFYFAWTNSRMDYQPNGNLNFSNDFKNLLKAESDNIFLVKFSYWLDM
jgi:hypothetical protein